MQVFNALIGNRNNQISIDSVRALNMIDVVFHDAARVRGLWHEYFDMLSNKGLENDLGWKQRQKKNLEMITEMAKVLGYGEAITHLDVDRVYNPIGLENQSQKGAQITDELLRVLKGTKSMALSPISSSDRKLSRTVRTGTKKRT
jgi:hypothetical protein